MNAINIELTKDNYFETNMIGEIPIISNSLLKNAIPMYSGSLKRLIAAFQGLLKKQETTGMALGSMLHAFVENPAKFVVEPEVEASERMRFVVDQIYDEIDSNDTISDKIENHTPLIKKILETHPIHSKWGMDTMVGKVIELGQDYWEHKVFAMGKIIVTGEVAQRLRGMTDSINDICPWPVLEDRLMVEGLQVDRELPLFWEYTMDSGIVIPMKVLIDILEVDREAKEIVITDLKSTGKPAKSFFGYYKYVKEDHDIKKQYFGGDYVNYAYFLQEYIYTAAVRNWAESQYPGFTVKFQFAVIENTEPHEYAIVESSSGWKNIAAMEFNEGMKVVEQWFIKEKFNQF